MYDGAKSFRAIPKPARIPPQTPPAGGKRAEAGRIHIPRQLFRPAESALVLLKKGSRKVYNYGTKRHFCLIQVGMVYLFHRRTLKTWQNDLLGSRTESVSG